MHKTMALSKAEAEHYSASNVAVEVIYFRVPSLLLNMGFVPKAWTPRSNNIIGGRERAKRIDIRKHFAHEAVQNGHVRLVRVSTSKQLADIFTQGLHPQPWATCIKSILGRKWEIP